VLSLLASELSVSLLWEIEKMQWRTEDVVLVHLPRDTRSVRRLGVDQANELAAALARETGLSHLPLLYRKKHAKQQKKLSAKQRVENLQDAFGVREVPQGCCVVLIDDVVTTGASLSVGAAVLRAAGVKELLCVCVAQTPKKA